MHRPTLPRPRHAVLLAGLAALAALATLLAPLPPAAQAAPLPQTPVFPSAIDPYPRYEAETECDPVAKPGAQEVVRILQRTYGTSPATNIPRACSGTGSSGHHSGRAIDWMTNSRDAFQGDLGDSFVSWLLATDAYGNRHAMARRLGVQYIIWRGQMFRVYGSSPGWSEYSNCTSVRTAPADDNYCHRNHVHVSLTWAGADATTSWYVMAGRTRWSCPLPSTPAAWTAPAARGLGLVPVEPARLLDTREADLAPGGCYLAPNARTDLKVTGRGGLPATGVAAVVLNLVAVDPSAETWLAAFPTGSAWSGTSSLNTTAAVTTAASVVVPVGSNGSVSILNGPGATSVVADVTGWFPADGSGARYNAAAPARAADQRLEARTWSPLRLPVPPSATAVLGNVVLDGPEGAGFGSLAPASLGQAPGFSAVNGLPGRPSTNRVLVKTTGADAAVYVNTGTRAVVDVSGWFAATGAQFYPVTPTRAVDSRTGQGATVLQGGAGSVVQLAGTGRVPAGARAVAATVTVTDPTLNAHATVWQQGQARPGTSDLNVLAGETRANLVVVPVDEQGRAVVELNQGSGHVVVDVLGYFR